MTVNKNGGSSVNYSPNSFGGPVDDKKLDEYPIQVAGKIVRQNQTNPSPLNNDFEQARALYTHVMKEPNREALVKGYLSALKNCMPEIQERALNLFLHISEDLASRVANGLGYDLLSQ